MKICNGCGKESKQLRYNSKRDKYYCRECAKKPINARKKIRRIHLLISVFLLLFLVGCTEPSCPQITCPTCQVEQQIVPKESDLQIHFINVGQGDAILIKYEDSEMLIDCGENNQGPTVTNYLKDLGITQLEYLLITHPDSDHLGGCDDVLQGIPTHTVITNGQTATTKSYDEVIKAIDTEQLLTASVDQTMFIGKAKMTILQAFNNLDDTNQNSIVSRLVFNNISFLLTGDCDKECENRLLTKDISSDILKVAHHGTKYGTQLDLIEKVNPSLAVICVGDNSYGHPAQETLDRLSQENVIVYRTDINGDIIIDSDGQGYTIRNR